MHVPVGYRLFKKLPMPKPSGLHKLFKKEISYPHGMIKSQYPANIGINLILMASNPFATMREKILFHAITSHEQFFYSDKVSQNFALCWGGVTTDRSF